MPNKPRLTDPTNAGPVRENTALPTRDILGISVSVATTQQALQFLDGRLQIKAPTEVSFLNANGSNLAAADPLLASALRRHVIFNDGIGVDIASRVLHGSAFPENLNGTDFMPYFLRNTRHVLRIFILGGHAEVIQRVFDEFRRLAPQHQYVGSHHGFFRTNEIPAIVDLIKRAQTDVLLVALGTPLQELWLADHFSATQCRLAFCVGGLLDFVSGAKPRAPVWLRRMRLEWIFRLMLEPRRMWRRYLLGNVRFLGRVARAAVTRK